MSMEINSSNYSQFYKGTQELTTYGSGANQKTTMVKYEFNTTDENGNHVMDKMTKEETMRTLNEISAMYDDSVIVSFSGDGLAALVESKAYSSDYSNYHKKTLDGREVPFDYEKQRRWGEERDNRLNLMKTEAPEVYKKYIELDASNDQNKRGWAQSLWVEFGEKTKGNKDYKGYGLLSEDGYTLKKKNIGEPWSYYNNDADYAGARKSLSDTYQNANFYTHTPSYQESEPDTYDIVLTKNHIKTLENGNESEREHIHDLIKNALFQMTDFMSKNQNNLLFGSFGFGARIGYDNSLSFFAQNQNSTYSGATMETLIKKMMGQN